MKVSRKLAVSGLYVRMLVIISLITLSCNTETENAEDFDKPTFFDLLNGTDTLALKLTTDIGSLFANKELEENKYQSANLAIYNNGVLGNTLDIEVRPRGITRKNICDFPPLMLKAPKKLRAAMDWRHTDNIKLVSYCKDQEGFQDMVYKEYLCYKLHNELTEFGFTVKLVDVTYEDAKGVYPSIEKTGFLIEPSDEMASRLGYTLVADGEAVRNVHRDHLKSFVVFQYMIGNTDWNMRRRHNIKMIKGNENTGAIPVPYDFDFSGFVNARYANPHPSLPIKSVTDRLFQWSGTAEEDFGETYKIFVERRNSFLSIINDFPYLVGDEIKSELNTYIEAFYENISSTNKMKDEMKKAGNRTN